MRGAISEERDMMSRGKFVSLHACMWSASLPISLYVVVCLFWQQEACSKEECRLCCPSLASSFQVLGAKHKTVFGVGNFDGIQQHLTWVLFSKHVCFSTNRAGPRHIRCRAHTCATDDQHPPGLHARYFMYRRASYMPHRKKREKYSQRKDERRRKQHKYQNELS